jgi:hypothetical protein
MTRFAAFTLLCLALAGAVRAQSGQQPQVFLPPENPRGVYAIIDLKPMLAMEKRLQTPGERTAAAREVLKDPGAYPPLVLYGVANVLSGDRPEEGIFWYHVGRLRAVYDAFRCKDPTARNVIPVLGKTMSPELIRSQHFQRNRLNDIARKAVDWDLKNPRKYDQRWICLYTKTARTSPGTDSAAVQTAQEEWPAALAHVHEAHLKAVAAFVAQRPVAK